MIYLINLSTGGLYDFGHIIVPYKAILIAVLGVFILILMTTLYSARKIKKENHHCPSCNALVSTDWMFCKNCGSKIN